MVAQTHLEKWNLCYSARPKPIDICKESGVKQVRLSLRIQTEKEWTKAKNLSI